MDDGLGLHGLELVNFCRFFSFTLQPVHSIQPLQPFPCFRRIPTHYSRRGWGMSYKQSRLNTPRRKQSLALLESGG